MDKFNDIERKVAETMCEIENDCERIIFYYENKEINKREEKILKFWKQLLKELKQLLGETNGRKQSKT